MESVLTTECEWRYTTEAGRVRQRGTRTKQDCRLKISRICNVSDALVMSIQHTQLLCRTRMLWSLS